jgi:hypothetical protein
VKTLINTEVVNQIENNSAVEDEPLLQEEGTIFGDFLTSKGYKIIYENVLFIIYETWRLWILTDGVIIKNMLVCGTMAKAVTVLSFQIRLCI